MIMPNILPLLFLSASLLVPIFHQAEDRSLRITQNNCVRSIPTPIVKKSIFPNTSFVLKKIGNNNSLIVPEGIETVKLKNGDRLTITNSGCESFALTFRFETDRLTGKTKDSKYWYRRSVRLMKQIVNGLNSPLNLKTGIAALENYSAKNFQPELDTEISYGGSDIRSTVRLGEITTAANGKAIVKILFYYGPL
jgi:hypothetical protein